MRTQIFAALACGVLLSAKAVADSGDNKTILTVDQAIFVPGATLQPGKYVVKVVESQANRHIVRVFNEQEDQVITTVSCDPKLEAEVHRRNQFIFWETTMGNPPALRAWFYPGDNFGQEFPYPKGLAAKIATQATAPVPAFPTEEPAEADLATAPVTTIETPKPAREPEVVAQAVKPPEPTPTPAPEPATMPATGSFGPAILMAGLAPDPKAIGKLVIPKLNVNAVIRDGTDAQTVRRALGHMSSSALPGETGNFVVTGHRDTFFRPLRNIRKDDVIVVVTPTGTHSCRVYAISVVSPRSSSFAQCDART